MSKRRSLSRTSAPTSAGTGRYWDTERTDVIPFVPVTAGRLLDVGCGRGGFGAALKRRSPELEVWGIDVDDSVEVIASARLDRFIHGPFPGAVPSGVAFDCVTFNDVLEHLYDPWAALAATRALLEPDGAVVAAIPNTRHYSVSLSLTVRGRWDYADTGLLDRTHVRFFTRATSLELFEDSGLRVADIRPGNLTMGRRVTSLSGRRGRHLRWLGPDLLEFLALHYIITARR